MAENEAKVEAKSDDSKDKDVKDTLDRLTKEQAFQYAEMLKPTLQEGVAKAKEKGTKAKGDMVSALKWFNSMSAAKQKGLVDMATGAATMTKDAVAALTETTAKEYQRMNTIVAEQGLSKAAQITATDVLGKAQELYASALSAASSASSNALVLANLKGEEVLASESLAAVMAWADATKKAVDESVAVTKAKEAGGEALRLANVSYEAAFAYAEQKRVEALQLSTVYMTAAQDQMISLSETEQGKKLKERTNMLYELTKSKTAELQERPLVKNATEQLEANYKLASDSVTAAQDWVTSILGYQKEGKPGGDKIIENQLELVAFLESGAETGAEDR